MWVLRLDVVRVSYGEESVSGGGTSTCPGSQPSSSAPMSCSERRTPWPISQAAERIT